MTIVNNGLNRVRDLISTDIDKGQLGTDGTASASTDTDLIAADATTASSISKSNSDKTTKFTYTLLSSEGTSTAYKEFKLYRSTSPITTYDRIVFTAIPFVSGGSEDIIITKKYFYKSV